ncbi:hypothetical protein QUA51_12780 [Microcoleus sp. Pol10_D6]
MSNIREIEESPGDTWDDLSWTDLNDAEQALWKTLAKQTGIPTLYRFD